jgi:O-antigen ligase
MLISQTRWSRCRLGFELLLAILLLLVSFARAGFVAALFSSFLVLGALRQYRLLIKISSAAIALGVLVVMILPPIQDAPKRDESQSVLSMFLYKGKPQEKAWSSRKGPWEHTWSVITENPWFGSGFGTSQITEGLPHQEFAHVGASHVIREHGSSYLAITEWVGLLGVIPFLALVGLLLWHVQQVIVKLLRNQYVPPLAIITAWVLLAGLINAFFEDWLFAVGYYMCVFFWSLAFIFMDLLHFQGSTSTHQDSSEISAFAYSR